MKKKCTALLAFAIGGAASAQSTVTLFGVLDVGVSHYETKSTYFDRLGLTPFPSLGRPTSVKTSQTALTSSNYTQSRLGFRGVEDLGGGLAAGFWLEAGITNDDGVKGINSFNRRSTVSLSGPFGEFRLGRDYVPTFWNDVIFDPFGVNGVGASVILGTSLNLAIARGPGSSLSGADPYARASNSVGYFLPPKLGGFYGQVQYAFPETTKTDNIPGTPSEKGRYVGGRMGFANGPLDMAIAYGVTTAADQLSLTSSSLPTGEFIKNELKTVNVGGSYDLDVVKLFGELSQITDKYRAGSAVTALGQTLVNRNDKYKGGLVGISVPVGAGVIRASYSIVKYKADQPWQPINQDASANKLALGYGHNLSRRTALYAAVSRTRIKDGEKNPAVMAVQATPLAGPAFYLRDNGETRYAPRSSIGYEVGIRHSF